MQEIKKPEPKVVIENPKGSYKSFEIENDPVWKDYPLAGVTYPVDYGYIEGYNSEDGHDLDVFTGTGDRYGYIKVWRYDVPLETKMALRVTESEWQDILKTFAPVIKDSQIFANEKDFLDFLATYKK